MDGQLTYLFVEDLKGYIHPQGPLSTMKL